MTQIRESAIAALLTEALDAAANDAAGGPTQLVSVAIEMVGAANFGVINTAVSRKTRTLVFASAELVDDAGARVAAATSVHKIKEQAERHRRLPLRRDRL